MIKKHRPREEFKIRYNLPAEILGELIVVFGLMVASTTFFAAFVAVNNAFVILISAVGTSLAYAAVLAWPPAFRCGVGEALCR